MLQFTQLSTGAYGSFDSRCDRTMVGFVQGIPSVTGTCGTMSNHQAQCFVAKQTKGWNIESTKEVEGSVKYAEITDHTAHVETASATTATPAEQPKAQMVQQPNIEVSSFDLQLDAQNVQLGSDVIVHKRAHGKRSNPHHDHVPSDEMDAAIEAINTSDLGWKADTCKLSKNHHMYDCDTDVELIQVSEEFTALDEVEAQEKAAHEAMRSSKTFGQGADFDKVHALATQY